MDSGWTGGLVHHALSRFRIRFQEWMADYWSDLWDSNQRDFHFPLWNLSQSRMLPRVPTLQEWNMFERDAMDLPRAYADEQGWNTYHPKTRDFLREARMYVQLRLRRLRQLQRHLF